MNIKINRNITKAFSGVGLSAAVVLSGVIVANFEGKSNKAYLDPVNILTICYGETKNVKQGEVRSDTECLNTLRESLAEHDKQMMSYILVPITDKQHAALLSFKYNIGTDAFRKSTLLKKLNNSDYVGACNELLRWNKAGGKVLPGLTKRRETERELCLQGTNNEAANN